MSEIDLENAIRSMASGMLMYGNQYDPDGLARFVEDYPELAGATHLRERAWALSVQWLSELPTKPSMKGGRNDAAQS